MTISPDELAGLLDDATSDLGGAAPDFAPVLAQGRRRRRNRRLATTSGVVAAVALLTGGVIAVTRPDTASRVHGPADTVTGVLSNGFAAVRDVSATPGYGQPQALVLFAPAEGPEGSGPKPEHVLLPGVAGVRYDAPTISPDGQWVYFVRDVDGPNHVQSTVERIPAVGGDPQVVIASTTDGGPYRDPVVSPNGTRIAVAQDGDVITTGVEAAGQGYDRWPARIGEQDTLVGYAPGGDDLYVLSTLSPDGQGDRLAVLRRLDHATFAATDVQSFSFPVGDAACGGAGISATTEPGSSVVLVIYGGCGTPLTGAVIRDGRLATSHRVGPYFGTTNAYRPMAATPWRDGIGGGYAFTFTHQDECPRGGPVVIFHGSGTDDEPVDEGSLSC